MNLTKFWYTLTVHMVLQLWTFVPFAHSRACVMQRILERWMPRVKYVCLSMSEYVFVPITACVCMYVRISTLTAHMLMARSFLSIFYVVLHFSACICVIASPYLLLLCMHVWVCVRCRNMSFCRHRNSNKQHRRKIKQQHTFHSNEWFHSIYFVYTVRV